MNASLNITGIGFYSNASSHFENHRIARALFDRARSRGLRRHFAARLFGRTTALCTLASSLMQQNDRRSDRVTTIPLERILGSESRSEDFDNQFNPLKTHNVERWTGILLARRSGVALPPVELLRNGEHYYVRDGHHCISVAKALGQLEIEAVIVN